MDDELLKRIITYYEVQFYMKAALPSKEDVLTYFHLTNEEFFNNIEVFNKALAVRGLGPVPTLETPSKTAPGPPVDLNVPEEMDPNFVWMAGVLADPSDKRSVQAKLKTFGFSTRWWQNMLLDPKNRAYYSSQVASHFLGVNDLAKISLVRNVEAGDLQSIKHVQELTGEYRPNQQFLLNIGVILGKFMEIIAPYLDSKALMEIADKFEGVIETSAKELN